MEHRNPTLDNICDITEELPEDWQFELIFSKGCLEVVLYDPDGNSVDLNQDDMMVTEMILSAVNHARAADGLCTKVTMDGHGNVETRDCLE